ncbi:hypothetical protein AZF37_09315 [endosymbiont 'TC1' of Trimyema compressum]|uniref:leucine-rich repeat domain-containing protein n=1 Tax=endosymbiont 'TC1' of Trimyema compressum TaxID=243899 RepID=UPI0007F0EA51|nr:leucine-rich repeat domain-containing protein [endosymbiont 'TC1' of Trimyema compressum]AMP21317.1 hypothetical protein AZF37_09315 [endosymbiont 'TC1' of Trimyema compressum]
MKVLIITLSTLIILAISMLAFGFINKPVNAAVGDTIAKTFPDANLAQAVADKYTGGNTNSVFTTAMSQEVTLDLSNRGISDLTGIGNFVRMRALTLDNNNLTTLPEELFAMGNLDYLFAKSNQLSTISASISNLTNLATLDLSNNQLASLPSEMSQLILLSSTTLGNNLLPTNYQQALNDFGLTVNGNPVIFSYENQNQLSLLDGVQPFNISTESDFTSLNLASVVKIDQSGTSIPLSSTLNLVLTNYIDTNSQPVDINNYVQGGNIIQSGTVYAQVRVAGTGLYPNNSDHAITTAKVQLNFNAQTAFNLSFNLNGGTGTSPANQVINIGDLGKSVTDPTRTGYTFKGWATTPGGSVVIC